MRASTLRVVIMGFAWAALTLPAGAQAQNAPKIESLRGDVPVEATSNTDISNWEGDQHAIPRDFVQQPPLIPHSIKGYTVTKNFNKCMDCHSWSRYKEKGAVKISLTHFKDRDGNELSNLSPRRYFCLQCHVPQANTTPLVENTFKPVGALAK